MKLIKLSGICALALFAAPHVPTVGSAPAGPGGVYYAAEDLIEAIDAGNAEYLESAFVGSRHGVEFTRGDDGKMKHAEPKTPFDMFECGANGRAWRASTAAELVAGLAPMKHAKLGRPTSVVTAAYADCPSGECSYVVVEFERTWGEGKGSVTVPMRATGLARYVGGEAPQFRFFHWHAAPRLELPAGR